ncbi:MAG: homogentisate 1,2-dioxygenase [Pseudobdellovibrionaceae bacterium]
MIPYIKGQVTTQAHVGVPEGTFEEEYARNGFSGRYAHLYRSEPPVQWISIEGPLRPQAYDLNQVTPVAEDDYLQSRAAYLENKDVRILFSKIAQKMKYYFRNADGDEVLFIHKGHGVLETDFGPMQYEPGDYVIIPRGTVYRLLPVESTELLIVESFSEVRIPDKGMLGQHALFDPAVLKTPEPVPASQKCPVGRYELKIQRCGKLTSVVYPFCPLNTVGWKGTLTVWQLNVRDIRPVLSDRYHLPPSAHSTFIANNFVICSFLPRPLENGDPQAMKVPFYHSNIDFDEVLFYHQGQFFSRAGIQAGMMTFHPQGIHHGPQNQAVARTEGVRETNEIAIMIDTKNPLVASPQAESVEIKDYWKSWMNPKGRS